MNIITKAITLLGAAFQKAGKAFDDLLLGYEGIQSEKAAAQFEALNFFAKQHGLRMTVEEKGWGVDHLPENTMRVLIKIPHKSAGFHGDRKIAIDIDLSTEETTQAGFVILKKRFYIEAEMLNPSAVPQDNTVVAPK